MTDYNSLPGVRWSTLKAMRISPLHYAHAKTAPPREPSAAMRIGTAIHTLVLEPDQFESRHPVYSKRRAGKEWDAFVDAHPGADILSASECAQVLGAAGAVRSSELACRHMDGSYREQIVRWTDADTGLECKARVDLVNGHLVELKSSHDIVPRRFARTAATLGYAGQLAFYLDGLSASGYATHGQPAIITVEQSMPHDVVVYVVPDAVIEGGRQLYKRLLERVVVCTETGRWPGISDVEVPLYLPEWAYATDEDEEPEVITLGGRAIA